MASPRQRPGLYGPGLASMIMPRVVAAETLDGLAESDPHAMRSRRDLQRIHRLMGTRTIVARALRKMTASRHEHRPLRILELGAGDGSLMLGVARAFKNGWPAVELTLLDRQQLVSRATLQGYADAGWSALSRVSDVFDWVANREGVQGSVQGRESAGRWDLIICNLFLHHFEGEQLQALLAAIEARTEQFFACEPRRGRLTLGASHLVGVIGANAVTREDAVLSVRAGFRAAEISQLWPSTGAVWVLDEHSAGLFSHCFSAWRHVPSATPKT